jgi:hypothetical protein
VSRLVGWRERRRRENRGGSRTEKRAGRLCRTLVSSVLPPAQGVIGPAAPSAGPLLSSTDVRGASPGPGWSCLFSLPSSGLVFRCKRGAGRCVGRAGDGIANRVASGSRSPGLGRRPRWARWVARGCLGGCGDELSEVLGGVSLRATKFVSLVHFPQRARGNEPAGGNGPWSLPTASCRPTGGRTSPARPAGLIPAAVRGGRGRRRGFPAPASADPRRRRNRRR